MSKSLKVANIANKNILTTEEQEFTENEKAQIRANLGISSSGDFIKVTPDQIEVLTGSPTTDTVLYGNGWKIPKTAVTDAATAGITNVNNIADNSIYFISDEHVENVTNLPAQKSGIIVNYVLGDNRVQTYYTDDITYLRKRNTSSWSQWETILSSDSTDISNYGFVDKILTENSDEKTPTSKAVATYLNNKLTNIPKLNVVNTWSMLNNFGEIQVGKFTSKSGLGEISIVGNSDDENVKVSSSGNDSLIINGQGNISYVADIEANNPKELVNVEYLNNNTLNYTIAGGGNTGLGASVSEWIDISPTNTGANYIPTDPNEIGSNFAYAKISEGQTLTLGNIIDTTIKSKAFTMYFIIDIEDGNLVISADLVEGIVSGNGKYRVTLTHTPVFREAHIEKVA